MSFLLTVLSKVPRNAWITLGCVLAVLLCAGFAYRWAFNRGADSARADCIAEQARAIAAMVKKEQKDEVASVKAAATLDETLNETLPKIEANTHDVIERVRVIYKDNPIAADCERPADIRRLLSEAIDKANQSAN